MSRAILHVDLDAFYASVEQRDDPKLRGKPVIVGGSRRRGVVCAASYEARKFGVRSAMPMAQAIRCCPRAIVLPPRMDYYAEVSGEERLLGDGPAIARKIKREVRERLSLIASVGVAPTKFVAKIASDLGKPDGLVVVGDGEERSFLHPLPVWRLWGVGRIGRERLGK